MTLEELKMQLRSGALYSCDNEELAQDQLKCLQLLHKYNKTKPLQQKKEKDCLKKCLRKLGITAILNHLFIVIGVAEMYILEKMYTETLI